MEIVIKSAREIEIMRQAGRIVAETIAILTEAVRPGIATRELDELAYKAITERGAAPSFKGYRGFPASICVSVNDEIVHGIPGKRALKDGDIVSLDVGAYYQGFHGDGAVTLPVGKVSERVKALLETGKSCLAAGIAAAQPPARVGDVSAAIQHVAEEAGFSVVREYTGHGVGRDLHEDLHIPNFGQAHQGPALRPGMTLAIEPMINMGGWPTTVRPNGWTVVTADGGWSAHFEHTIAIGEGPAEILTRL